MFENDKFRGKQLGTHIYEVKVAPPATPQVFQKWTSDQLIDYRLTSIPPSPMQEDEKVIFQGMCSGRTGEQLREAEREIPGVTVKVKQWDRKTQPSDVFSAD